MSMPWPLQSTHASLCLSCALWIPRRPLQPRIPSGVDQLARSQGRTGYSSGEVVRRVRSSRRDFDRRDESSSGEIVRNGGRTRPQNATHSKGDEQTTTLVRRYESLHHYSFTKLLKDKIAELKTQLEDSPMVQAYNLSEEEFEAVYARLLSHLTTGGKTFNHLKTTHSLKGSSGVDAQLRHIFNNLIISSKFSKRDLENQQRVADLRHPLEWYPRTRSFQRKIIMHVGPTNSGKTFQALKRLEEAKSGCYAGPLRLLAHEVYTRLNAKGQPCVLLTGEERRVPENSTTLNKHKLKIACTVEMMPTMEMDVAVIDEIQMIGSSERGWAWTEALLGSKAKEIHLCGEERTVPLIKELAALMGDPVEVHHYERLSPLAMAPESLRGDLSKLQKGDCLVSFSILAIHQLKSQIQRKTGRNVAIVYGSLPPETRASQAKLFNDPNNDYDYLVASDAVGMGLNLSIKRVVFEAVRKRSTYGISVLPIPDIKQIAGRAGRYKTAYEVTQQMPAMGDNLVAVAELSDGTKPSIIPSASTTTSPPKAMTTGSQNLGLVTTLDKDDYHIVKHAMASTAPPLTSAGILPPASIVQRFCSYFSPGTPFSYVLLRLTEVARVGSRFHICDLGDVTRIADAIHSVENLTPEDRLIICQAPASLKDAGMRTWVQVLAKCIADGRGGSILEVDDLELDLLDRPVRGERPYLRDLELLHKKLIVYLWLSYRFPGVFPTRALAMHVKELVEVNIEKALSMISFDDAARRRQRELERKRELLMNLQAEKLFDEELPVDEDSDDLQSDEQGLVEGLFGRHEEQSEDIPTQHADKECEEDGEQKEKRNSAPLQLNQAEDGLPQGLYAGPDAGVGPTAGSTSPLIPTDAEVVSDGFDLGQFEGTVKTTELGAPQLQNHRTMELAATTLRSASKPSLTIPFQSIQPTFPLG